jgi:hypothetical protein
MSAPLGEIPLIDGRTNPKNLPEIACRQKSAPDCEIKSSGQHIT